MTLDEVLVKVTDLNTVEGSVETLLTDIAGQLRQNAGNPAKIQSIADQLDARKAAAGAAVAANTDLATPPVTPPTE